MPKEKRTESIPVRVTPSEKKKAKQLAEQFGMDVSTYFRSTSLNTKETEKYARRITSKALVTASYSIDAIYDEIAKTDSEYIEISKILPHLDNARKELNGIWYR